MADSMIGPFASAIAGPVATAITQAGAGGQSLDSRIRALFAKYSAFGGMYDFTDASTLFQAAALMTPVTASGQSVWSVADISGQGNHLTTYNASTRPQFNGNGVTPDGVDDFFTTAASLDLTACDKAVVGMGYTKVDNSTRMQMELSASANSNAGAFGAISGANAGGEASAYARGSSPLSFDHIAYMTYVSAGMCTLVSRHSIPGDLSEVWWNGVKGTDGTGDKGTGNFGSYPLYLLSRGGNSLFSDTPMLRAIVLAVPAGGAQVSDDDVELIRLWLMGGFGSFTSRIAAIGDSTVAAYAGGESIPALMPATNATIVAAQGNTIAQQLSAWSSLPDHSVFDVVVIQVGLNDLSGSGGASSKIAGLQGLVNTVRGDVPAGCKVYVSKMLPCYQRLVALFGAGASVAQQQWADINDAVAGIGPSPISGVDGRITAHVPLLDDGSGSLRAEYDTGDHIHPNNAGRLVMATEWKSALNAGGLA